jgi:hypothetical protein
MSTNWYSAEIRQDNAVAVRLDANEAVRKVNQGNVVFLADPDNVHDVLFTIQQQRGLARDERPAWSPELTDHDVKRLRPFFPTRKRRVSLAQSLT